MSSFVIDKKEYMKAAGLVTGSFGEGFSSKREYLSSYWYDRAVRQFYKLYVLNVESCNLQYCDTETPEPLNDSDKELYEQYRQKAIEISKNEMERRKLIFNLNHFFRSVSYQIEDKDCEMQAANIIYRYLSSMISSMKFDDDSWWGSIKF